MKLFTIFTILICLIISEANSQQSTYYKNPSEMSKKEFLNLATGSDSLTAIVNMFFRKRNAATTTGLIVGGGVTIIGAVAAIGHAVTRDLSGTVHSIFGNTVPMEKDNNPGLPIVLIGAAGGAAIIAIGSAQYNKNELHRVITEYHETKQIPYEYASKLTHKDFSSIPRRVN